MLYIDAKTSWYVPCLQKIVVTGLSPWKCNSGLFDTVVLLWESEPRLSKYQHCAVALDFCWLFYFSVEYLHWLFISTLERINGGCCIAVHYIATDALHTPKRRKKKFQKKIKGRAQLDSSYPLTLVTVVTQRFPTFYRLTGAFWGTRYIQVG